MRECDKREASGAMRWLALSALALAFAALLLASCARTVYVPAEASKARADTLRITVAKADSVYLRDSVAVVQRGDTVYHTVWRDRYRWRLRTDTVYKSATDTVRASVPYPVERKLTRWERAKQDYGGTAMAVAAAAVCFAVAWMAKRMREKNKA